MLNDNRSCEFASLLKSALFDIADRNTSIDTGGWVCEAYDGSRDHWVKYRGEEYIITAKKCKPKVNNSTEKYRAGVAGPATEPIISAKPFFDLDLVYKEIEACIKSSGQGNGLDDISYNNGLVTALNILQKAKL